MVFHPSTSDPNEGTHCARLSSNCCSDVVQAEMLVWVKGGPVPSSLKNRDIIKDQESEASPRTQLALLTGLSLMP